MELREVMLIIHFIGLAMGVGTGFAMMFIGIAASKMTPEKRNEFILNATTLGKMGHTGLGLLILTGLFLMTPYWSILSVTPLLIAKISLVVVLFALVIVNSSLARKAKQGNADHYIAKMGMIG